MGLVSQSLSNIVSVTVEVSPTVSSASSLNVGLIVGSSPVIPTQQRVATYQSTTEMLTQGWTGAEPEYKAAEAYFSQSPTPTSVMIGRQDLTASETLLQAIQACREQNAAWYGVYACGAADTDITAIAEYIQSATPFAVYFYDTADTAVLNGTAGNIMDTLQKAEANRTLGLYSTTPYAGAAVMGLAMGLNTGLANFAFTLAYKTLVGVTPENLTAQQVATILGYHGNVFTTYGNAYELLVQGTMADGTPFDQQLNLDLMAVNIQTTAMNALLANPKIPQTDAGVTVLLTQIAQYLDRAVAQGILAPGVWNAPPVLGLQTGATLAKGYVVLADSVANQSETDRQARKSPPIYACVKMAGAIEHVVIGVIVNA